MSLHRVIHTTAKICTKVKREPALMLPDEIVCRAVSRFAAVSFGGLGILRLTLYNLSLQCSVIANINWHKAKSSQDGVDFQAPQLFVRPGKCSGRRAPHDIRADSVVLV